MIPKSRVAQLVCGLLISSVASIAHAQSDAPVSPQFSNAPVYVYRDDDGTLYRWQVTFSPGKGYTTQMVPYTQGAFAQLSSEVTIAYLPLPGSKAAAMQDEQQLALINPEAADSACTSVYPNNFTIYAGSDHIAHGNINHNAARPLPYDTWTGQYVDFQFTTSNYYGQPSHTLVALFSKYYDPYHSLEGWGGIFGNNSQDYDAYPGSNGVINPQDNPMYDYYGCGTNSLFNTQIEAWYLLPGGSCCNANFQSRTFPDLRYPVNSCGVTLGDGYQYRMQMQASTGSWVSYQVLRFISYSWYSITGWKGLQTNAYPWIYATPTLDISDKKDMSIAATDGGSNWSITVSNLTCGWYY